MPEVHERAAKFLTASSYLCAKLTGRFTIDRYLAEDFLPLYDRETWQVNERGCARFCRPDQMAEVMAATDIAGVITDRAAVETGLARDTPVLVGTGDSGARGDFYWSVLPRGHDGATREHGLLYLFGGPYGR